MIRGLERTGWKTIPVLAVCLTIISLPFQVSPGFCDPGDESAAILFAPVISKIDARQVLKHIDPEDAVILADPSGRVILEKNGGTLHGVRTRAGYITGEHRRLFPFCILLNTPGKTDRRILGQLEQIVKKVSSQ